MSEPTRTPSDADLLFQEAASHFKQGNVPAAEDSARQALARDHNHSDTNHLLGLIAGQRGDYATAAEFITHAIEGNAQEPLYYFNLGAACLGGGRFAHALQAYDKAIELRPSVPETYVQRGNTLRRMGRTREALVDYERAVVLSPSSAAPHYCRGIALMELVVHAVYSVTH